MGMSRKDNGFPTDMLVQDCYYLLALVLRLVVLCARLHVEAINCPASVATTATACVNQPSVLGSSLSHFHRLFHIVASRPFIFVNDSVLRINAFPIGKRIVHEQNQSLVLSLPNNILKPPSSFGLFCFILTNNICGIIHIKIINVASSSRNSRVPIILPCKGHERKNETAINPIEVSCLRHLSLNGLVKHVLLPFFRGILLVMVSRT